MRLELARRSISIAELSRGTDIPVTRLTSRIDGGKDFRTEELAAVCRFLDMPIIEMLDRANAA